MINLSQVWVAVSSTQSRIRNVEQRIVTSVNWRIPSRNWRVEFTNVIAIRDVASANDVLESKRESI